MAGEHEPELQPAGRCVETARNFLKLSPFLPVFAKKGDGGLKFEDAHSMPCPVCQPLAVGRPSRPRYTGAGLSVQLTGTRFGNFEFPSFRRQNNLFFHVSCGPARGGFEGSMNVTIRCL